MLAGRTTSDDVGVLHDRMARGR